MATSDKDQNINAQLFKELSDRFPDIPKDVISNKLRMTGNDRAKCLQDLQQEAQNYYRGQQTLNKGRNFWMAPSSQVGGVHSGAGTLGANTGQTIHMESSISPVQPKDFDLYTSDTSSKPSNIPNINCMHSSVNTSTPSVQETVQMFEGVRSTSGVRPVPVLHINSSKVKPVNSGQNPLPSNTPCISYHLKTSGSSGGTCFVVDRSQSRSYDSPLHISTETSKSSLNRPREGFSTTKTIMINQPFNGQSNTMMPVTNSVSVFDRQGTNSSTPIQETSYAQEEHSNNRRYGVVNDNLSSASNQGVDNVLIKPTPPVRPGGMKEEEEYIRALLHHQEQRYENLLRDYNETKEQTMKLKQEVAQMEMNLLLNSTRRNSFPTIEDVTKLREENRRLQTDIQCMSNEVDMTPVGQYGLVDPVEQQNFYQNMPTGPTGPIGKLSDSPIPLPPKPSRHIDMNQVPPVPPRQSSAGSGDSEEGEQWNCSACTFLNHPALNKCECCEMPRIGTQRPHSHNNHELCYCHDH